MSVWPITSRMALSAAFFTVVSGSRILNRYWPASLITHRTVKSMSMMFSSPVSIRLSSITSRSVPVRRASPVPERKPISIRLTRVTLGVSAVSIGAGM